MTQPNPQLDPEGGPGFRIATHGLGFTWAGRGPTNPDRPEAAVNALCLLDTANRDNRMLAPADRIPGGCLVIGPVAADGEGAEYVLTWSRHAPSAPLDDPGRVSLVVIRVEPASGLDGQRWRERMIAEATRTGGRYGALHYHHVKAVEDFRALPHVLVEAFGADGQGWAGVADWWLSEGARGAEFVPLTDKES